MLLNIKIRGRQRFWILSQEWFNNLEICQEKSAIGGVLWKNCSWKSRKIHMKTPVLESRFNKVLGLRPSTLLKRDSSIGVSLWILRNFWKHLFYRTPQLVASHSYIFGYLLELCLVRNNSLYCIEKCFRIFKSQW